jgi:putative ATP-dependent endonuclease of OLD family
MRLFRVHIRNFRNFRDVECRLGRHSVILGENGAGKSNLLYALRLLLDPTLPDALRYLDEEDFWDGGTAFAGTEVVVTVDLTEYEDEPAVLACLADHEVTPPNGWAHPVARLTYHYAPRDTVDPSKLSAARKDEYDFAIYGRDDRSNGVSHDVRRFVGFTVLPALRDAEGDLRAWKRSPLRPLLESARDKLDAAALQKVADAVDEATDRLTSEKPLADLEQQIGGRLNELLGRQHDLAPTLGFKSTNPQQLVQALQLFMDEDRLRQVSDTSLGLANVLYLSLLLLHTEQQEKALATAATLIGIEEPEAHLHPQMQRVVFRDLLGKKRPVLVSTHSPNIASVAPVESLVVLRSINGESAIASFANSEGFSDSERSDLERYLDVTRAELVFGRGVILVEGDAEKFVIPAAARLLPTPVQLDDFGVTVCSVAGTDFVPYAKLLKTLGIPHVVVTDGDERDASAALPPGISRGKRILEALDKAARAAAVSTYVARGDLADARTALEGGDIFVGLRTLETDLVSNGAGPRLKEAFRAQFPTSRPATVAPFDATGAIGDGAENLIIGLAERAGKGRFAQSFAPRMVATDVPKYIRNAIEAIVEKCRRH